jgi:hypothetical protein
MQRKTKGATMQTITTTTSRSSFLTDGPRVVERTRGSAHPKVPTTRQVGERRMQPRLEYRRP